MNSTERKIAESVLRLRLSQMIINEKNKNGDFKIPIHLGLGHEAIAVAVDAAMKKHDKLVLSHRNVHYNLARSHGLREELDEYYLKKSGLAQGQAGSMNLANREKNIVYSSSILGNNFAVGSGLALGEVVNKNRGVVITVTGDGAMEEGSFYESLLFQRSNNLSTIIIIENNQWSLGTRIGERRSAINIKMMAESLGAGYVKLEGNDSFRYVEKLKEIREDVSENKATMCVEVELTTLGSWYMETPEFPQGKFINYHAGPAPTVGLANGPIIAKSKEDPVYVVSKYFPNNEFESCVEKNLNLLHGEIK
jgi:TPP-dependent pyruvate/acetoin dehydrogenase alpha subunit